MIPLHSYSSSLAYGINYRTRLVDDNYTQQDVEELISGLCAVVKQDVQKELLNTSHMNVLLLRQFMVQAEKIYLDLEVDTNELENQYVFLLRFSHISSSPPPLSLLSLLTVSITLSLLYLSFLPPPLSLLLPTFSPFLQTVD